MSNENSNQVPEKGDTRKSTLNDVLSASEAVYGLLAWLTCRDKPVTFSASHNAAIAAELADEFCKANDLPDPRENYHIRLKHPHSDDLKTVEEDCECFYCGQDSCDCDLVGR